MTTLDDHAPVLRSPRRGVSTPALLITLSVALLLAIAAIDLAQLSHQRQQIQIGADAAALAATPLLVDRVPLYLGPEGATPDNVMLNAIRAGQIDAAQQQAIHYAGLNTVANRPIILDANPTNAADGDVVLGFVAEPALETLNGTPAPDGSFNSLAVRASRRKAAGELPLLWMARQVGLENLEMKISSQAVVDQRIYGFRPLAHVPAPLLPVAVLPNVEDLMMFPDAKLDHLWWSQGPHDNYTVDERTHEVVAGQSDGIAEMVIRIETDSGGSSSDTVKTRQGALVGLGPDGDRSPEAVAHYSQFGYRTEDFVGGQLHIEQADNPPIFPATYEADSDDLANIRAYLLASDPAILGAPRILPVGAQIDGSSVGIVGFVAGSIVHCEQDSGDESLLLVVQPCLLQSPTALAGGQTPRNPWIGKLLLNR